LALLEQMAASESIVEDADAALRLTHVSKRYGGVSAVRDISFAAKPGEVHALLGENGAGKSTLMGIASGVVRPDSGTVEIRGERIERASAAQAQSLGLAIVHQHPAVLPELTVAENMLLAVPARVRGRAAANLQEKEWVAAELQRVGCDVSPHTRMSEVGIAQRQLYELAKALAIDPKVLILDEPTAALTAGLVELLFEKIRAAAARGAAVVYITHRLHEVRQVADRVTVMRDGEVKGAAAIGEISDGEILRLIVGRTLSQTFPPKGDARKSDGSVLTVAGLSGSNFYDVSMTANRGEIIGLAGITGNGQSEFIRALAGLTLATGKVKLGGKALALGRPAAARALRINYLSADRQEEGLFMSLSVRENAALSALPLFSAFGFVRRREECDKVEEKRSSLAIRSSSLESNVGALSGGNQQKVLIARALLAEVSLLLAEEPTAGVDMGSRAEIYRILREVADRGAPVIIVSSDGLELQGLCDRVFVFSRGHVVGELAGGDVAEEAIGRLMVTATSHRKADLAAERGASGQAGWRSRLRAFAAGDHVSSLVLILAILLVGAYVTGQNSRFLSAFNAEKLLFAAAALSFVAFGQLCAVLAGGIDLSVGPLVGLCVVVASFFFGDVGLVPSMALGLGLMFLTATVAGVTNGVLVRFGNFTPVAATLGVYIVLQGLSLLLRPFPNGSFDPNVIAAINVSVFGVPVAFVAAAVAAVLLEVALRYTRWGLSIRAVGSNEPAASKIGVRSSLAIVGAFLASSLLTALGATLVMAQLGIGDPNQGVEYTLGSIAAVVLSGASLAGGRGTFIGVLLGAVLIQEVNSSTVFLGLSQAWQYWFIGLLTLIAVALYSQSKLLFSRGA
jgi:ribose transport system ATP-binding protein